MEVIAPITAFLLTAGTIFTAIYNARNNTEKTLQQHITNLEGNFQKLQINYNELAQKYEDLQEKYIAEKERGDSLELQIKSIKRRRRNK